MAFLDRVTRRRLVLGLLLAASLALLTVYFREQNGGQLHGVQSSMSDAASPVEGAVQRVAQPFRDAWSWSRDLVKAKGERDKLAKENAAYRLQIAQLRQAAAVNADAEQLLQFKNDPRFGSLQADWRYVPARVTVRAPDGLQLEGADRRRHRRRRAQARPGDHRQGLARRPDHRRLGRLGLGDADQRRQRRRGRLDPHPRRPRPRPAVLRRPQRAAAHERAQVARGAQVRHRHHPGLEALRTTSTSRSSRAAW